MDGPEGHAGVSEHLWGSLFPQQSGHDTLGLYIEPWEKAGTWVTIADLLFFTHLLASLSSQKNVGMNRCAREVSVDES